MHNDKFIILIMFNELLPDFKNYLWITRIDRLCLVQEFYEIRCHLNTSKHFQV